jgi:hypothetical protein
VGFQRKERKKNKEKIGEGVWRERPEDEGWLVV